MRLTGNCPARIPAVRHRRYRGGASHADGGRHQCAARAGRSAGFARRRVGRVHGAHRGSRQRQAHHAHLDDELGRRRALQLTRSEQSEHTPRWSPDGKYLSFLTARGDDEEPEQVWLLDRAGGEASPLTGFNGDVVDYAWSPDGRRLALIVADEDPRRKKKGEEDKTPPPIVIDRYYFKEDETGYLGNAAPAFICVRRREPQSGSPDAGPLRRRLARVVARRQADRVLQQARRPIRIAATSSVCTSWQRSRARRRGC